MRLLFKAALVGTLVLFLLHKGIIERPGWDTLFKFTACESTSTEPLTVDSAAFEVGSLARSAVHLDREKMAAFGEQAVELWSVALDSAAQGLMGKQRSPRAVTYQAQAVAAQAAQCAPPPASGFVPATLGPPSPGSGPGSWGGYSNGQIPSSALVDVGGGERLEPNAAAAFLAMNAAYKAATGSDIPITDSYRDYAGQVACRAAKGDLCATPGFSNHGWGKALDLGAAARPWVTANGPTFGWILPAWAQPGGSKPEEWHFEFVGTNSIAAG